MAGQIQGGGGDQFDFYFRRADLNGDGRISGAEAVAFFQGSNLPKQVLAQIWMHADQNRTGFLGRPEFYNALKLVTVAQSKRDLTPDIVKAALFGPAAAKIPPPQINLPAIPQQNAMAIPQQNAMAIPQQNAMGLSQQNAMALSQQNEMALTPQNAMATPLQNAMAITPANAMAAPVSQMRPAAPMQPHNLGIRGQVPPNATMNQNYLASQQNQSMLTRPPLSAGLPANTHAAPPPQQELGRGNSFVGPNTPSSNLSAGWFSGKTPSSTAPQDIPRGTTSAVHPVTSQAQNLVLASVEQGLKDSKISAVSGNGFAPNTVFGNDVFSAASTLNKQDLNTISPSSMNTPSMSAVVPASTGLQSQAKLGSLDSLQTDFTMQPANSQLQRAPVNPNQHVLAQSTPTQPSRISAGPVNSSPDQSQMSWPKMKPSDVQKYTKVFVEVDSDRDGKITGEQARNLFMSWRLPREVLNQVWDLSDQDNDSMLSLREFCIALYLMERYREGRALPAALPSNVLFDETLSSSTGLPASSYGNASWGANPGLRQQPGAQPGVPITSAAGLRAPVRAGAPHPNESVLPDQNKRDSELEEEDPFAHFGSRKPKPKKVHEEKVTEKKVEGAANSLMDSKEKIEFYRMMMQELVLYKSRCDNRLNEITERALADKREAESLGKKYEEKYKQVADIASKLTIEEAKFRETQERKMELQQAIIKMEQGGSADGLLQVRADRIQSDADELMKALTERCKIHGLNINSAALFELPKGWQPGIQEGAAVWDEEWDKFEDEGFSFAKDIKRDSQNNTSGKSNSGSVLLEKGSPESVITASHLDADGKSEKLFRDGESAYSPSEDDLERSSHGSPDRRGSPAREFSYHSRKSTEADAETYRAFDEPSWGNFDSNEDVDSVWGFNPTNTKDLDSENRENYLFGSGDLGSDSVRSGSPQLDPFQKKSPFVFADSVPSTPHSKFGNSPLRYGEGSTDHFFDTSSRFDSLSIQDGGYSPRCESLSRFDSVNSSRDFGHDRSFTSFDDADPFGSSGPFKVSSERESSRKDSGSWNAF